MTNAIQVHQLLLAKASELGLPLAFHRDLDFHDLNALTEAPDDAKLLWGIGECGTHIIPLRWFDEAKHIIGRVHGPERWFVIYDGNLQEVSK